MNIEKGGMSAAKATGGEQPELGGENNKTKRTISSLNNSLVILFLNRDCGYQPFLMFSAISWARRALAS